LGSGGKSSTKSSTVLAPAHYPARTRHIHAECPDAGENQASYPYKMKVVDMTQRYRKFKRSWGMWYAFDNVTGNSVSLKTRVKAEAETKVAAMNETERQPSISLGLAKVYLNATDPKLATRTWQEVMEHIVAKKKDETKHRWETAIKDVNFDCIRKLHVAETRPEHFDKALADGKVSTNVYLRRIHNHALGMEWLLKSVIPRLQWPRPNFKGKRAITAEEHAAIIAREMNPERRDLYELLWHTGAAQSDGACLRAEDINWEARTICYTRKKLKGRANIKPALIRFGAEVEAILRRRPEAGPLFPYLATVRPGDRASEFRQRCKGLKIKGVTLHSYRYAWAERALKCGYPERFAQQALGHNSKAVHNAYAKHAEVTVPCLDDWERGWTENVESRKQKTEMPVAKLLPVDFRLPALAVAQSN
jgi:integrase